MSSKNSRDEWRPPSVASAAADHSSTKDFMQAGSRETGRRIRQPSWKALQNAIENQIDELSKQARILKDAADNVYDAIKDNTVVDENLLKESVERYEEILQKLEELYAQDKWGDNLADADRIRQSAYINLKYARTATLNLMAKHKRQQDDNASRTSRRSTRKSYRSSQHSTSSSLRAKVIAEAAAAKAQAEYDRLLAEKEHQRRQHELEEQRLMDQRRAQYDKEIALITADRVAAIADAKLDAIERSFAEEKRSQSTPSERESVDHKSRMQEWVLSQQHRSAVSLDPNITPPEMLSNPSHELTGNQNPVCQQNTSHQSEFTSPALQGRRQPETTECLNAIVNTNKQLTASLARQALPKCQPDTFSGDATLFHPWKIAFKAMTQNAEVPPEQEINYLRQFTQGEARKLVDSYRKRQHNDPNVLLSQLWKELEKRFGNTALIASTLMKKLLKTAKFVEKENKKLQDFADVCSELDSQLESLPGLACLNYPNAISPVLEKLPLSLRSKWEKEVAKHAEENHNAYPGFHKFTIIVQKQATFRNHPNILASLSYASKDSKYKDENNQTSAFDPEARVLKTRTHPPNDQPEDDEEVIKKDMESKCPFHDKKGHDLTTCKTFARKTLSARMEWIKRSRLCFRCFSPGHQASTCILVIKCNKC